MKLNRELSQLHWLEDFLFYFPFYFPFYSPFYSPFYFLLLPFTP